MKLYRLAHHASDAYHNDARDVVEHQNRRIGDAGDSPFRERVEHDYLAAIPAGLRRRYRVTIEAYTIDP